MDGPSITTSVKRRGAVTKLFFRTKFLLRPSECWLCWAEKKAAGSGRALVLRAERAGTGGYWSVASGQLVDAAARRIQGPASKRAAFKARFFVVFCLVIFLSGNLALPLLQSEP